MYLTRFFRRPLHISPASVELPGPFRHIYVHTRGVRLHAAVAGSATDPLILLLHSSTGGWFDFREVIAPLAQAGYHVAALDLRGFGLSDKPPAEPGQDLRTATGDIAGVIAALGHSRAIVVGEDTGGALGWLCASQYPELVQALVSIAAVHPQDMRRCMRRRPWDFQVVWARHIGSHLPSVLLRPLLRRWGPAVVRSYLAANCAAAFRQDPRYDAAVELRLLSLRIPHVRRAAMAAHRLLSTAVPLKWRDAPVVAPVSIVHAPQRLWRPVIQHAQRRVQQPIHSMTIAGTKNLPHLEDPAAFCEHLSRWLAQVLPDQPQP